MLNVKKQLYDDIVIYCKLNNILDVESFCNKILEIGFNVEKYGPTPIKNKPIEAKPETIIKEPEKVSKEPEKKEQKLIINKGIEYDDYSAYDV